MYSVLLYDNISDFSKNGLSHVLALTSSIGRGHPTVARFTERLITYLSPKTYLTTHLRPKTCLILKICIKTCHKSVLVVN